MIFSLIITLILVACNGDKSYKEENPETTATHSTKAEESKSSDGQTTEILSEVTSQMTSEIVSTATETTTEEVLESTETTSAESDEETTEIITEETTEDKIDISALSDDKIGRAHV